jgi:hypothetical protein
MVPLAAQGQKCPNVDPASGYPLSASSELTTDSAWLGSVARAAAYRWQVPSRRRNAYTGWEQVQRRLLPPEPRWADDWSPQPQHRAVVRLTMFRDAKQHKLEISTRSGDRQFDNSRGGIFETAVRDGLLKARFRAPTSNCRPVAQTVVQTFGR